MKNLIYTTIIVLSFTTISCNNTMHDAIDAKVNLVKEVQLEPAGNVGYACGYFGDPPGILLKSSGDYLIEGVDYIYDKALDNFD